MGVDSSVSDTLSCDEAPEVSRAEGLPAVSGVLWKLPDVLAGFGVVSPMLKDTASVYAGGLSSPEGSSPPSRLKLGADRRLGEAAPTPLKPVSPASESALLTDMDEGLLLASGAESWAGKWAVEAFLELVRGGQHLEASQPGLDMAGPRGQDSMQSSVEEMESVGSVSTNSGWIVVEWIPSLWKNSFTCSAICMY